MFSSTGTFVPGNVPRRKSIQFMTGPCDGSFNSLSEPVRRFPVLTKPVKEIDVVVAELVKYPKTTNEELMLKNALIANEFSHNVIEGDRLKQVIEAMYPRKVNAKEYLIREGELGSNLFISGSGTFEVTIKGEKVLNFSDNRVFGELAILYTEKRQASVQVLKSGKVWVLDRSTYQQIIIGKAIKERDELIAFLRNVPKLPKNERTLGRVANLLKSEFFNTNTAIIRQNDRGDKFYIIRAGSVTVSKIDQGIVGTLSTGQFFGELALLKEDCRQATVTADAPGVECLTLSRQEFLKHFKDLDYVVPTLPDENKNEEFSDVTLEELNNVATIGVGGFGSVCLVTIKRNNKQIPFALKRLGKFEIVQQDRKEYAYSERDIQRSCNNAFIVKLYNTFSDPKFLYFLMEPCMGGDLLTLLQRQLRKRFEQSAARFYSGSVLEALSYLHERNVIFRDLKPENIMLQPTGYVKLCDFGSSKKLELRGHTYTFAGTPEYVAPEIILNRGYDRAVDYWALGILIFELLVGRTPFRTADPTNIQTYNAILAGIRKVQFPNTVPFGAEKIIVRLCRSLVTDRLGCKREGADEVRAQEWFDGFDWEQLRAGMMKAPHPRPIKNPIDLQYFDPYPKQFDSPPDETSGWDYDF